MNFNSLHLIIVSFIDIFGIWLVSWVYFNKPRERISKLFVVMAILMFIWINFACIARLIDQIWLSLILIKIAWLVTPLFFASLYLFSISLIQEEKKYLFLTKIILFLGIVSGFITGLTNLILKGVRFENGVLSFIYGKGISLFLAIIFFMLCATLYSLFNKYFKLLERDRAKIRIFLIGILIFYSANIIFNIFFPVIIGISHYYYLGDYSLIFLLSFIAYAIVRYRLFDIKVAIGRVVSVGLSVVTILVSALLIGFLNYKLENPLPFTVIISFIALLSVVLFQLSKLYNRITARYLYPTFYQTEIAIAGLEEKLTQALELNTLSLLISDTLRRTFNLEKIAVLIKDLKVDNYQIQKNYGFEKKELLFLVQNPFTLTFFKKIRKPFGAEELKSIIKKIKKEKDEQEFQALKGKIVKMEIGVLIPLLFGKKLIAVIVLGKKATGEPFTIQDLELLKNISFQASVALKNASLYSEIKKGKEELERFYRLTVGRELKMTELKDRIRKLEEELKSK